jgi:hypothetical protein
MACAIISGCASTKIARPDQISAYKAAMAGKSHEARTILKQSEDDSFSKFLLSCIELSEGNLTVAKRYADEFMASNPNTPDGRVLTELIAERKAYPSEPWTTSFASAWKASGSPKLTVVDYLEGALSEETENCESRKVPEAVIGTPNELLVAGEIGLFCDHKKFTELCLAHTSSDTPMTIKLLALKWLDYEVTPSDYKDSTIPADLLKTAQQQRRELVQEFSVQLPLDIAFAMMKILDQTSEERIFSLTDIENIEKAVSRPRLAPMPEELYNDYLKRFIALGSWNPQLSATNAVFSTIGLFHYPFILQKKISATAKESPELRVRLAAICEKLGKAQLKQRTLIELMEGTATFGVAAELGNNHRTQEQYRVLFSFMRKLIKGVEPAMASIYWPIRPLMIDSLELKIKDAVGFDQLFSDEEMPAEYVKLLNDLQ